MVKKSTEKSRELEEIRQTSNAIKSSKISIYQLSSHVKYPAKDIQEWLKGKKQIPYMIRWKILDFFDIESSITCM